MAGETYFNKTDFQECSGTCMKLYKKKNTFLCILCGILYKVTATAKLLYMLLIVLTCGTLNNSCVTSQIEGEKKLIQRDNQGNRKGFARQPKNQIAEATKQTTNQYTITTNQQSGGSPKISLNTNEPHHFQLDHSIMNMFSQALQLSLGVSTLAHCQSLIFSACFVI